MNSVIFTWKRSLSKLLELYDRNKHPYPRFLALLFLSFVAINLACYWFALFTAFPESTRGPAGVHYFKVQFPVGILGAIFDSLSFFVTIFIVRRALRATSGASYIAHLSVDFAIAIMATWWVLFVFTISGWIISQFDARPEQAFLQRTQLYEGRALDALRNPSASLRNIYFGLVMGASAMIPTAIHIWLSFRAFLGARLLSTDRSAGAQG